VVAKHLMSELKLRPPKERSLSASCEAMPTDTTQSNSPRKNAKAISQGLKPNCSPALLSELKPRLPEEASSSAHCEASLSCVHWAMHDGVCGGPPSIQPVVFAFKWPHCERCERSGCGFSRADIRYQRSDIRKDETARQYSWRSTSEGVPYTQAQSKALSFPLALLRTQD
jgi:hypothetical protein